MPRVLIVVGCVLVSCGLVQAQGRWIFRSRPHIPTQEAVPQSFYVDPDYVGSGRNGSTTAPWQSLSDAGAWTAINASLTSGDVTVYFSARDANSDIDETSTIGLTVSRTDTSSNLLTLDGETKYNSNDTTPSWSSYPARTQSITNVLSGAVVTGYAYGGSRFKITAGNPVSSGTMGRRDYVTVQGFKLVATANQCVFWWDGEHITITKNHCTSSAVIGPAFYFAGQREEGRSNPCVAESSQNCRGMDYLTISYNYLYETRGEGIYLAGCANWASCPYAKDNHYLLNDNVIFNPAYQGGEGDAIDIKTALIGTIVRHNYIRFTNASASTRSCLETMSGVVLEQNYCDAGALAILGFSFTGYWSYYNDIYRIGSTVRNNTIVNIGGASRGAIYCWGDSAETPANSDFTGLLIDNNTTYLGPQGIYIGQDCTGATVRNNVLASSTNSELAVVAGVSLTAHSNNTFYKTSGTLVTYLSTNYTSATLGTFEATGLPSNPVFVNMSAPYVPTDFSLQAGSPAIDSGATLGAFATDFASVSRPQGSAWDRGAWEKP